MRLCPLTAPITLVLPYTFIFIYWALHTRAVYRERHNCDVMQPYDAIGTFMTSYCDHQAYITSYLVTHK